ncbi:hypothetical protein [Treponema endosymbiont of Eucomonympha sp.]|uniref:hypothetical protein n=1 Tax=Treponema endosymbiont of Eucomonympha sp. TaxID=1580831 RepID=UPI001396BBF3
MGDTNETLRSELRSVSLKSYSAPSSAGRESPRATQSSPLPSSPPFMSDVCSSTFQSTPLRVSGSKPKFH